MAQPQIYTQKTESHSHINLDHDRPPSKQAFIMPLTLTQTYFTEQTCDQSSRMSYKNTEDKDNCRSWADDQHLKLCQIFIEKGLIWHEITSQFQKRQKAEIKQHLSSTLKKIFQQLTLSQKSNSHRDLCKDDFRFGELKRMVKYISSGRHSRDQFCLKNRKVIGELLSAHLPSLHRKCKHQVQKLQELKQALLYFRQLLQQKNDLRGVEHRFQKVDFAKYIGKDVGYESDFQSAFSENVGQFSNKQSASCHNLQQNNQSEDRGLDVINQNVIIKQGQDKIKALLHQQGLLIYVDQNQQREDYAIASLGSDCDMLDNDSYQQFCSCNLMQDEQFDLQGEAGWRKSLCVRSSQQQD